MARMFPPDFDETSRSAGEMRIFQLLKTDPDTTTWLVLHSLGLSRRPSGPYGEIDFVVLVPGEGLICLEVKGGRVSCEAGVWKTMNRFGTISVLKRSPMMQAREAMFALRDKMREHFGEMATEALCPIGCAVVFPDVECPPSTPEFDRSDVVDVRDLQQPISKAILRITRHRLRELQPRGRDRIPTQSEAKAILNFIRPDFDLVVARGVRIGRSEEKLVSLTEEQYCRLDELEDNPRCLFEGAAGTGKTLLALEYARRRSRAGASVLLLCFNRLLGTRLEGQMRESPVRCGTYHSIVRKSILESSLSSEFLHKERLALESGDHRHLFDELYPFYGELALEELDTRYDVLVVDEAQDLCRPAVLDVLNRFLKGGLACGSWAIFGDFTRQALYGTSVSPISVLRQYCEHFTKARLTMNCRNTRRIAEETVLLAGFERAPFRMGQEVGLAVDHRYWSTATDLIQSIGAVIRRLCAEGVVPSDIAILSPRRLQNSGLCGVTALAGLPLRDVSSDEQIGEQTLVYSTIHAFKGLESAVVIVIDIEQIDADEPQSLLYVAMSRARALLVLMIRETARDAVERRIRDAMTRGLRS